MNTSIRGSREHTTAAAIPDRTLPSEFLGFEANGSLRNRQLVDLSNSKGFDHPKMSFEIMHQPGFVDDYRSGIASSLSKDIRRVSETVYSVTQMCKTAPIRKLISGVSEQPKYALTAKMGTAMVRAGGRCDWAVDYLDRMGSRGAG